MKLCITNLCSSNREMTIDQSNNSIKPNMTNQWVLLRLLTRVWWAVTRIWRIQINLHHWNAHPNLGDSSCNFNPRTLCSTCRQFNRWQNLQEVLLVRVSSRCSCLLVHNLGEWPVHPVSFWNFLRLMNWLLPETHVTSNSFLERIF